LKLDELLRGVKGARTGLVDLEDLTDEELKQLQDEFQRLRERHGDEVRNGVEAVEEELDQRETEHAG